MLCSRSGYCLGRGQHLCLCGRHGHRTDRGPTQDRHDIRGRPCPCRTRGLAYCDDVPPLSQRCGALQQFVVPVGKSSFFLATVALTAFFEMPVAFVVAETGNTAVEAISEFHLRRYEFDVYHDAPS